MRSGRTARPGSRAQASRIAARTADAGHEIAPHRHDSIAGLPVVASQFLLRRGWRYKWQEMGLKLANPRDRARSRLPPGLGWAYPLLSIGRLIGRVRGR